MYILSTEPPEIKGWQAFLKQFLMAAGVLAIVAGVIFFLAFNWDEMGRFGKFALVEGLLVLAVVVYLVWARRRSHWLRATLLLAIALLVGGTLALLGQTYQSGADTWELFALWALLITPLVLVGQTSGLWLLWGGLWNLAMWLYLDAVGLQGWVESLIGGVSLPFVGLNLLLGLVGEMLALGGRRCSYPPFLHNRFAAQMFMGVLMVCLTALAFAALFDSRVSLIWLAGYGLVSMVLAFCYRWLLFDLPLLVGLVLSWVLVGTAAVARLLDLAWQGDHFLLLSIVLMGLSSLGGYWLHGLWKTKGDQPC